MGPAVSSRRALDFEGGLGYNPLMISTPIIISYSEAKATGLVRYFTGNPCKNGHVAERLVSTRGCTQCGRERLQKQRIAHPERFRGYDKKYYENNKTELQEKAQKRSRLWRENNIEKARERRRMWGVTNPEKVKESYKKWYTANRKIILEKQREKRAANPEKYREQKREWYSANKKREQAKIRRYNKKRYYTPLGQLRATCKKTAQRLVLGKISKSKLELLGYNAFEFITHLESTLPKGVSFEDARANGWHIDHIVPLAVLSNAIENKTTAFQVSMDLGNLRMIPSTENLSKNATLNLLNPEQTVVFEKLMRKYALFDELLPTAVPY